MTAMKHIGCSGFFGPPTRYWPLFTAVEITDTEIATPGEASVRRWLREAPKGFAFSVLAPREIAQHGFTQLGSDAPRLLEVAAIAKQLSAEAIVFVGQPDFRGTQVNKARVRAFIEALPKGVPPCVFDLPGFSVSDLGEVTDGKRALPATNPLTRPSTQKSNLVYHRLPGPAGHRSRYDEDALARIAESLRATKAKETFCIFSNIDALANATPLAKQFLRR